MVKSLWIWRAAGLWWVLVTDRAALRIPFALLPLTRFWGGIPRRYRVVMRLITAAFANGRGGGYFWCDRDGPGHFGSFAPTPEGGGRRVVDGVFWPQTPGYLILTSWRCCGASWAHDRLQNCSE